MASSSNEVFGTYTKLFVNNAEVVAYRENAVWIRSRSFADLQTIDPQTGSTVLRISFPPSLRAERRPQFIGALVAFHLERNQVWCLDAATDSIRWRREGELRGVTPQGFLIANVSTKHRPTLLEVDEDGSTREVFRLASPSPSLLPAAVVDDCIWVIAGAELIGIDRPTNADSPFSIALPAPSHQCGLLSGEKCLVFTSARVTAAGCLTDLFELRSTTKEWNAVGTLEGELWLLGSALAENLVVAIMRTEGEFWESIVYDLRTQTIAFRFSVAAFARASAFGCRIALPQPGALVVISRAIDGTPQAVRIPIPTAKDSSVSLGAQGAAVMSADELFLLSTRQLEEVSHDSMDHNAMFSAIGSAGTANPTPAPVLFVGANIVMVEHPHLGRLNLRRESNPAAIAQGDFVLLDSMFEKLPGLWKVDAWHRQGDPVPVDTGAFKERRISSSNLPPLQTEIIVERSNYRDVLRAFASRLHFSISPLLDRMVASFDRDPTCRTILHRLGLAIRITGYGQTWEEADPCILGLIDHGTGDIDGFYVYPPAQTPSAELPVVSWYHEDNSVEFLAPTFETYVADKLSGYCMEEDADLVAAFLEYFRLPSSFLASTSTVPPPWFSAVHSAPPSPPEDLDFAALIEKDPLQAERLLVRMLVTQRGPSDVPFLLEKLYEKLGWTWHKENLLNSA